MIGKYWNGNNNKCSSLWLINYLTWQQWIVLLYDKRFSETFCKLIVNNQTGVEEGG